MNRMMLALCFSLGFVSLPAMAEPLIVGNPWVRSTVAGQKVSGAFMTITAGSDVVLVGASSPMASELEIHQTTMGAGIMRMRAVRQLDLPAGKTVTFSPGSYHLMLIDLKKPLQPGMKVPIALNLIDSKGVVFTQTFETVVRDGAGRQEHAAH